jgi:hypothetical protein
MSDVTGVNGCIFGVSDLQPGRAAPKSAIHGPSGTFVSQILQARSREGQLHPRYVLCTLNRIFANRLLGRSWIGGGEQTGDEKHEPSRVIFSVITSH